MCWVGTRRNDFFFVFFLSFMAIPNLFWLGKKQQWCFLIFLNFFATFFEFSITGRVGTNWNDFYYFLSFLAFPNLFWLEMIPLWCFFNFFNFFWFFFFNFLLRVLQELKGTIFLISSLSRSYPTYFGLKRNHNGVFFLIFCYLFGILYYRSGKNSSERFFLFFLFLGLPQHILAQKEAKKVFSNFFNFFAFFLKFSMTGRAGTRRNDFFVFYFLSFSAFPNLFWLDEKP